MTRNQKILLGVVGAIVLYNIYKSFSKKTSPSEPILKDGVIKSSDSYRMVENYASKFPSGAVLVSPNPLDKTKWMPSQMDVTFKITPSSISVFGVELVQTDQKHTGANAQYNKWVRRDAIVKI